MPASRPWPAVKTPSLGAAFGRAAGFTATFEIVAADKVGGRVKKETHLGRGTSTPITPSSPLLPNLPSHPLPAQGSEGPQSDASNQGVDQLTSQRDPTRPNGSA